MRTNIVYPFYGNMKITRIYGYISSSYNAGYHTGLDLVPTDGDNRLRSITSGVVQYARNSGSYGKHVYITNPETNTGCLYCHMKDYWVVAGQQVSMGQQIGFMGATGNVTGPHLHLECTNGTTWSYGKNLIDPAVYLGLPTTEVGVTIENTGGSYAGYSSSATSSSSGGSSSGLNLTTEDALSVLLGDSPYYKLTGETQAGDYLFGRKYRVIVVMEDGQAFEVSQLHCKFSIAKTYFLTPNQSEITIYNLSAESENAIIKQGQKIVIEAGYEGGLYGRIFEGNILQPLRYKEDETTYALTLYSLDGNRYILYSFINQTLVAGQTSRDVAEACASRATIPIEIGSISDNFNTDPLPRAKVLFGMSRDYMNQIANQNNAAFSVQDGKAEFNTLEDQSTTIFKLSPETGLLGTPQQIENGISFKCLLNPQITIGTAVQIDNSLIRAQHYETGTVIRQLDNDGIYKVYNIKHVGDTRGNDWYTECEAVAQAGLIPAMMEDSSYNTY